MSKFRIDCEYMDGRTMLAVRTVYTVKATEQEAKEFARGQYPTATQYVVVKTK
jgi:hypothetical protein